MTTLVRRNQNWLPYLLENLFDENMDTVVKNRVPAINIKEAADKYTVEVAAPGMTKDDFSVSIDENDNLVISLEKKCECDDPKCECNGEKCESQNDERYIRHEFSFTKFKQSFYLPEDVDKEAVKAKVENGVLSIELPKFTEEKLKKAQRSIEIA